MSVGWRAIEVTDGALRIPAWLLYPAHAEPRVEHLGPYELEVARDAPAAGEELPLVLYSHGNGATPWVARGLLLHLAQAGFVVATLEHPGNNRNDNSLSDAAGLAKRKNLEYRPRHAKLVIDAAFADRDLGPRLRAGVGVVGHSIGGYTAVAIAGGHAMSFPDDVEMARRLSPDPETLRLLAPVDTVRDPRVRAAVLLAPALAWFGMPGALAEVAAQILVRVGEQDALCPPAQVQHALRSLPAPASFAIVPNAGHFSFLSPFPPALAAIPPAHDPAGFDRAAYQRVLCADVTAFLRAALA
jgi:predicted dienelactone hydrolase